MPPLAAQLLHKCADQGGENALDLLVAHDVFQQVGVILKEAKRSKLHCLKQWETLFYFIFLEGGANPGAKDVDEPPNLIVRHGRHSLPGQLRSLLK